LAELDHLGRRLPLVLDAEALVVADDFEEAQPGLVGRLRVEPQRREPADVRGHRRQVVERQRLPLEDLGEPLPLAGQVDLPQGPRDARPWNREANPTALRLLSPRASTRGPMRGTNGPAGRRTRLMSEPASTNPRATDSNWPVLSDRWNSGWPVTPPLAVFAV